MGNQYIGSDFDSFLEEEGLQAEAQAEAIKRVVAWQLKEFMESHELSKTGLAKQLNTSRSALDRLLDEHNTSISIKTLSSAAALMGKRLEVKMVDTK